MTMNLPKQGQVTGIIKPYGSSGYVNHTLMVNGVATALSVDASSTSGTVITPPSVNITNEDEIKIRVASANSDNCSPEDFTINVDFL